MIPPSSDTSSPLPPPAALARPVLERIKDNGFIEAGPHDFRLGAPVTAPDGHWSPFATAPDGETLWWTATPRPLHESAEPFYYLAQYRTATHLCASPASALPPAVPAPRRFVFSVGRCGSTLLGQLAAGAGLTALSEPDALTPFALTRDAGNDAPAALHARLVYAPVLDRCLEGWRTGAAEEAALVKLRAQHSNASHLALILDTVARPAFTFVFREPRAWARSMAGHFGLPVDRLVALYSAPIAAHAAAMRAGAEATVLHYEAMRGDGREAADVALAALGLPPGAASLPDTSSQQGTRLARPPADTPAVRRTVHAFMERWPDIRAGAAAGLDLAN